eukprot:gene24819-31203_t
MGIKMVMVSLFFVHNNQLTGSLSSVFDADRQPLITSIDVSNNQFTGPIPTTPFMIRRLQTFAAVSNCLKGSIPAVICSAHNLTSLALDGLSTATSCQTKLAHLPGLPAAYGLQHSTEGGVPSCLFNMSQLNTLHLSGNGIIGSISDNLIISPSLTDLSLSYNSLTGTIPLAIQNRAWITGLGLSSNKLGGVISRGMPSPLNSTLNLKVNRLSGPIPASLLSETNINIDILSGNIFKCPYYGTNSLPRSDPQADTYSCGTNIFDAAIYTWVAVLSIFLALFKVAWNGVIFQQQTALWKRLSGTYDVLPVMYMLIFNTIVCPILATLAVSPDCFRDLFVAPSPVQATYQYQACDKIDSVLSVRERPTSALGRQISVMSFINRERTLTGLTGVSGYAGEGEKEGEDGGVMSAMHNNRHSIQDHSVAHEHDSTRKSAIINGLSEPDSASEIELKMCDDVTSNDQHTNNKKFNSS